VRRCIDKMTRLSRALFVIRKEADFTLPIQRQWTVSGPAQPLKAFLHKPPSPNLILPLATSHRLAVCNVLFSQYPLRQPCASSPSSTAIAAAPRSPHDPGAHPQSARCILPASPRTQRLRLRSRPETPAAAMDEYSNAIRNAAINPGDSSPHIPRQANQFHPMRPQAGNDVGVMLFAPASL